MANSLKPGKPSPKGGTGGRDKDKKSGKDKPGKDRGGVANRKK